MENMLRELERPKKMSTYSKVSKFASKLILDFDFDDFKYSLKNSLEFNLNVDNDNKKRCFSSELSKSVYPFKEKSNKNLVPRARYKSFNLLSNINPNTSDNNNRLRPNYNYEKNKKTKISKFSKISKCSDLSNIDKKSDKSSFNSSLKNHESEYKSEYESVSVLFKNDITIIKEDSYEHNIFKSNTL